MTQVRVHVGIGGEDVVAGTLYSHRRRGTESASFTYATQYLGTPGAYAVDPSFRSPAESARHGWAGHCSGH